MTKRKYLCLISLVIGIILATGAVSAASKNLVAPYTRLDKKGVASPSDGEKKKKKKDSTQDSSDTTTEATTEQGVTPDLPTTPTISSEELARITSEYSETLKEKVEVQQKLNKLMTSQNNFIKILNDIDDMIIEYQGKIEDIEQKTQQAQATVSEMGDDIQNAEIAQQAQYEFVKQHIAEEYENGTYTYMDALFNAVDYTDIVNKTEYIQAVDSYNNRVLTDLTKQKQQLLDKKALLETISSDMGILAEAYKNEQETLEIISKEKENQIKKYESIIASAKSELASIEALEQQQSAMISQFESSYSPSFSYGGGNPGLVYNGDDFLWPMPCSTKIVSYYGPRVAPTAGASTFHRGIDIDCPMASQVIAVAKGEVIYVGYLGTAGNAVIIDHGSGISSCYFHLSDFICKKGDSVEAGEVIALSGSTGVSTGPHLHFAVRENGQYVNPLKYYKTVEDKSKVSNTEGNSQDNNSEN